MRCEVCGRKIHGAPIRAEIEGARLTVCTECSKHGKIVIEEEKTPFLVNPKKAVPIHFHQKKVVAANVDTSQEMVEGYDIKIRQTREKLGISHEELGKKINEKASVLRKIETRKMAPNNLLVTKLEHALKIKLLAQVSEEKIPQNIPKSSDREMTLGDLIKLGKKGGEETTERKP